MPGKEKSAVLHKSHILCDLLFLAFAALYAMLACQGIMPLSADGARMDSDLETYAQGMAGQYRPEMFARDPVLHDASPANSIPNLQRFLAGFLTPGEAWAIGLLRAGALAIFVFYSGWYILGRWLCKSPAMAALLALLSGATIWVGWGTFWGITHSDPVPRSFFAAIFPFLLLLGISAIRKAWQRPLAMLACGLCMWVHGVSALNCGAMFFLAFLFLKPKDASWKRHFLNCALCLAAFFAPVLYFLWPSLAQGRSFSADELDLFRNVFELRWQNDYSGFGQRIKNFLQPQNMIVFLLAGGLTGWLVARRKGNGREKDFCAMCPAFVAALVIVTAFCWAETRYAPNFGRLPMGHELVRGLRFLVPLSWIAIVAGLHNLLGKWSRRAALAFVIILLALFTGDRQYIAAQYALADYTGLHLPLAAKAEKIRKDSQNYREMLEAVKRIVPEGEAVFSEDDDMPIRYDALRPLAHAFKDGYVFFYNKDLERSKEWLKYETIMRKGQQSYIEAWLASGAPWLLCRKNADKPGLEQYGDVLWEKNGWLLVRKKFGLAP